MQEPRPFPLDITSIVREDEWDNLVFDLVAGARIYFHGDLWAWKSTFIRTLLVHHFGKPILVRSPTYTYFEKYGDNIYHFDLYRVESIEDFFLIGWSDIFEDPDSICLVEWPELIEDTYPPTLRVEIEKQSDTERLIRLVSLNVSTEWSRNIQPQ